MLYISPHSLIPTTLNFILYLCVYVCVAVMAGWVDRLCTLILLANGKEANFLMQVARKKIETLIGGIFKSK